jgi:3-deoxy-D-manno-octulosonic-acid transferase
LLGPWPEENTILSVKENMARFAYTLALLCLLPVLAGYLIWRGIRQPDYFKHWSERFLGLAVPRPRHEPTGAPFENQQHCKVLWVHAVSVGETRACAPLIAQWLEEDPSHCVVLTHTTPTGRETGRVLLSKWFASQDRKRCRIVQRYLPYDLPWSNALFLNWAKPRIGMLMETELWPNLLAQAKARNIPMVLANARLSPRSARRLGTFRWLARPAIASLAGIGAQTQEDADRLVSASEPQASVAVHITGNMKFDVAVPQAQLHLGNQWRAQLGSHNVFLAASTREDEELEILKAWRSAQQTGAVPNSLLLIVPRHPQRFDRVARMIEMQGFTLRRRSADWLENLSDPETNRAQSTPVLLGDSLGEMFAYLQLSDLVLIGGSIPALGGQNPIEACALGKPVFFGPHMFNFSQIAQALLACGAGTEVATPAQWIEQADRLLQDRAQLQEKSKAAASFTQAHRGASRKTIDLLNATLSADR